MTTEKYFFNYALPCADVLLSLHRITQEQYDGLQKKFLDGQVPNREELESSFEKAFVRIKRLAESMNLDYWSMEVMKKYWTEEHNRIINSGEGVYGKCSETLRDICRVHESKVIERKDLDGKVLFVVEYNSSKGTRTRTVFGNLLPDLHEGDKVRIHHSYAIEIV